MGDDQHQATADPVDGPLSVLLIGVDPAIVDALHTDAGADASVFVHATASPEAALGRLEGEQFDCLVIDPNGGGPAIRSLVGELPDIASETPVVLLTAESPGAIDEAVRSTATTIVERAAASTDWTFLVEKIRGTVRERDRPDADNGLYRMLVESTRDGLYRLDANGRFTYVNRSFAAMLGYQPYELRGAHAATVMADGELERGQALIRETLAATERESDIMDMEMVTKHGETVYGSLHFVVFTTAAGDYDGVMGVMRDVTERKERKRELERQNERLERFASIVSHDLRTPLSVVTGQMELARDALRTADATDESDVEEHLDAIDEAVGRMDDLIEDVLTLARQGQAIDDVDAVALAELAGQTWDNLGARTDAAVLEVTDGLGTVQADRQRLGQLLENLFTNALDHASADGDTLTVTLRPLPDGFVVADDGPGIPAADDDRIFESGYTSSEEGTGIGLAIVREIAEAHGWRIDVTDSEAGGAAFEVTGVEAA